MAQPSLNQLDLDIETLRVDATATLQALCARFEPEHTAGLRMLLNAAEYVQRTVIGPPEADPRSMLAAPHDLPSSCVDLDAFADPAELAVMLTGLGWPTAVREVWDEDEANSFASSARSVIALRFDRVLRVTVDHRARLRPCSALVEPGEYLACASGERLFFTEALCRVPHGRGAADLDLSTVPGFWVRALIASCDCCETAWRVDPAGDIRQWCAPADDPVWNFFEEASDFAYVSCTIACPTVTCGGRVAFELP